MSQDTLIFLISEITIINNFKPIFLVLDLEFVKILAF